MHKSSRLSSFVAALEKRASDEVDYWSYKRMTRRPGLHGLIRYPAMMVPQMQSDVLDAAAESLPHLNHVIDPFVGSGTTMLEAVRRGLGFEGYDINPLAILICRAKLLALNPDLVHAEVCQTLRDIEKDRSTAIDVDFFGRDKWFTKESSIDLSRVRRAIQGQPNQDLRRFLWVVFAETIRQTSLSRESTYKLHIRSDEERSKLKSTLGCFKQLAQDAVDRYHKHYANATRPKKSAKVHLCCTDVRAVRETRRTKSQLLITSPPYGNNVSTIPYGQFSYLSLQWIPSDDLEGEAALRKSAYATDTASLGGSSRGYVERALAMTLASHSFSAFFDSLLQLGRPDLEAKAASFTSDLFDAIGSALSRLEHGGLAIWTLGERSMGGIRVPLVPICREINEFFGMEPVTEITRNIQSKRMPHRNSLGPTMAHETLLVMSKP